MDAQERAKTIEISLRDVDPVSGQGAIQSADEARAETRIGTVDGPVDVADRDGFTTVSYSKGKTVKHIKGKKFKMARGITVDSGAHDNVMPRRLIKGRNNKGKIRPSEASKSGVHYVACNNGRIPNEGEFDFHFETEERSPMSWTFQVAEVNKALASVSALTDSYHRVVFDQEDGIDCSSLSSSTRPRGTAPR